MADEKDFLDNSAYEVDTFTPSVFVKDWKMTPSPSMEGRGFLVSGCPFLPASSPPAEGRGIRRREINEWYNLYLLRRLAQE